MVQKPKLKFPRLVYSNEILRKICAAAYGVKGNFEEYFRQQAQARWKRKKLFEKIEKKIEFLKGNTKVANHLNTFSF